MFQEISDIKKGLSKQCNIPIEGSSLNTRLVHPVPDGYYIIRSNKWKYEVNILENKINILSISKITEVLKMQHEWVKSQRNV